MHISDEFLEFISDGALAIEVWGHRCAGRGHSPWEMDALEAKTQTLRDRYDARYVAPTHMLFLTFNTLLILAGAFSRWSEVSRRIELWVSIQELNEQGEYASVELHPGKDISTGGVFQLRQVKKKGKKNTREKFSFSSAWLT